MQIYFENDFVTYSYDKVNHVIVQKWLAPPNSVEFRDGVKSLIEVMGHFNTGKVISDTTFLGIIQPKDQRWVSTEWIHGALMVGYSHLAVIVSEDALTQMSVEGIVNQRVAVAFPTAYFKSMEAAIVWIKQFSTRTTN
ncbi:hypothetical protein [Chryseolinea soli]|uniref:STAS/SEC14 domain-containing protein n=1 Tax=Chryseolinea soli TaxID=2321403 RepID=A0A385SM50_9BACT|nr:hypothetical protein [Chryseolinea soli]AYB32054.1 hypothetical protein D4L85_16410 [Chryseolinea soli]